jgi:hypothetical protein
MAKGKQRIGTCTYCGGLTEITMDHVVPRTLFTQPYPPDLITVPACEQCNNINKSSDDTVFRDYLTLDLYGNQSSGGRAAYPKVLRANERGQSKLARLATSASEMRPLVTSAGIYLGDFPTAKLEEGTIEGPLMTMVRGLYFYNHRERLPDEYQFSIVRIFDWDLPDVLRRMSPLHANGPYNYGDVFGYMYFKAAEDPFTTIWLMWFFNSVCFSVSTVEPGIVLPKGRDLF